MGPLKSWELEDSAIEKCSKFEFLEPQIMKKKYGYFSKEFQEILKLSDRITLVIKRENFSQILC